MLNTRKIRQTFVINETWLIINFCAKFPPCNCLKECLFTLQILRKVQLYVYSKQKLVIILHWFLSFCMLCWNNVQVCIGFGHWLYGQICLCTREFWGELISIFMNDLLKTNNFVLLSVLCIRHHFWPKAFLFAMAFFFFFNWTERYKLILKKRKRRCSWHYL